MLKLYYSHDPMCSFCWAFRPAWAEVQKALADRYQIITLVGGLAPDSDEPMASDMRDKLQATWRSIQKRIPGTEFNFNFWQQCQPRRSTYPACRAVVAAKLIDPAKEDEMIFALQTAYYLQAQNPSNHDTLIRVAEQIGLNAQQFKHQLSSEATERQFQFELAQSRALGINSFPSLVWAESAGQGASATDETRYVVPIDYNSPDSMLALIAKIESSQS